MLNSSRSRKWKSKKVEQATKNEEPMDTTAECSTTSDIISEPRTATPDATVVVMDTKIAVARDLTNIDAILFKDDIDEETRGDIIQFYNKLFIGFVKDYVLKFTPDEVWLSVYVIVNSQYLLCMYRMLLTVPCLLYR